MRLLGAIVIMVPLFVGCARSGQSVPSTSVQMDNAYQVMPLVVVNPGGTVDIRPRGTVDPNHQRIPLAQLCQRLQDLGYTASDFIALVKHYSASPDDYGRAEEYLLKTQYTNVMGGYWGKEEAEPTGARAGVPSAHDP